MRGGEAAGGQPAGAGRGKGGWLGLFTWQCKKNTKKEEAQIRGNVGDKYN